MRSGSTKVSQFLSGIGKAATRIFTGNKQQLGTVEKQEHNYPPERRPKTKKRSGGSGMYKRRNPRSMAGYLGHIRGTSAVSTKARLEGIYASMRQGVKIAAQRRADYLARREARELNAAQGMVTS